MADLFPGLGLGECLNPEQATITHVKLAGEVSKGDILARSAVVSGDIDSAVRANTDAANVIGVALKSGIAGEVIPMLLFGIVKVKAGGAITGGSKIKAGSLGRVVTAVTTVTIPAGATTVTSTSAQPTMTVEGGIAIGRALQTFAAADDVGLVLINVG